MRILFLTTIAAVAIAAVSLVWTVEEDQGAMPDGTVVWSTDTKAWSGGQPASADLQGYTRIECPPGTNAVGGGSGGTPETTVTVCGTGGGGAGSTVYPSYTNACGMIGGSITTSATGGGYVCQTGPKPSCQATNNGTNFLPTYYPGTQILSCEPPEPTP